MPVTWPQRIERLVGLIGKVCAWMLFALLLAILVQIALNAASRSVAWLDEIQWYLYGSASMIALSYTTTRGGHVRVDVASRRLPTRVRQCLEILWVLLFLVPLYIIMLVYGLDFTRESFAIGEGSSDPGGMPFRWIVKAFIPLSSLLLIVASVARAALVWYRPELLDSAEVVHGN